MKFEELAKLFEAKGVQPGMRYQKAVSQAGPSGLSVSPVGRETNMELRAPANKWDYDRSKEDPGTKSGYSESSAIWRNMMNAFGLLFNDKNFDKQIQKIAKTFNDSRDSYKLLRGVEGSEEGEVEKYDEEAELEKMERNRARFQGKITELEQDIKDANIILNHTKLSPSEKNQLELRVEQLRASIPVLTKQIKASKNQAAIDKYTAQREDVLDKLKRLEKKHDNANMKSSDIHAVSHRLLELKSKLAKEEEKFTTTVEKLDALYDRINKIGENNQKANDNAINGLRNYIKYSAQELHDELQATEGSVTPLTSLDQLDWEKLPQGAKEKLAMLKSLASDDPQINPILGYLDLFEKAYYTEDGTHVKDFDERELDANTNITKMRDFNRLPFMTMLRIYNAVRSSVKKPIPLASLDVDKHDFYKSQLDQDLKALKTQEQWDSPVAKDRLRDAIENLQISQSNKNLLLNDLETPWFYNARSKANNAVQMMNRIKSMGRESGIQRESVDFDVLARSIIQQNEFDVEDFKLNMLEIFTRK